MPSNLWISKLAHVPLLFAFLLLSCSSDQAPTQAKAPGGASPDVLSTQPEKQNTSSADLSLEDQVLILVSKALRRDKLLAHPDRCYVYRFDSATSQPAYTVDVRQNNSHAECGGDPLTQPHLFTVRVDKTTRALSDDARTPGIFLPLNP